ncbi:sugar ABC transporter substrate-binding protein [Rhizobium sp. Leaf386]|uniref:sugar ABC transporter substrate-binding protein n=1 Tax=Rhizobium sp. Leaf386 TaxID=1736359 RepID=UPI0007139151|nr:sugar ABC transporter substrate-binding protein [Rhizobium sp. Leaf386]KQS95489.1 sugar ABC transporter substrate-binding protein [Rhizobium sp. Leaf386]
MKKYARLILACAGSLVVLSGASWAKDLTFGYVPGSMIYPYNVATAKGFEAEAKAAGVKTVVLDPRGSVEKQSNSIDDLIAQKVDAIGFLPLDSVVAQSFVDRVNDKKIPIVAVALQVGDPTKRELRDVYPGLTALVAPDDVVLGERAATLALDLLPKDRAATIAIIEGAPGYAVVEQRIRGFKKGLDAAGRKYEIVGSQPSDWTPESGQTICQNFLTSRPDLDLIFSEADDMAIGCARAISASGSQTKLIATSGGSKTGNAAIASGELSGSVCVKPELLGRLMFKEMYAAATNTDYKKPKFVTIDLPLITKDSLEGCPAEW